MVKFCSCVKVYQRVPSSNIRPISLSHDDSTHDSIHRFVAHSFHVWFMSVLKTRHLSSGCENPVGWWLHGILLSNILGISLKSNRGIPINQAVFHGMREDFEHCSSRFNWAPSRQWQCRTQFHEEHQIPLVLAQGENVLRSRKGQHLGETTNLLKSWRMR